MLTKATHHLNADDTVSARVFEFGTGSHVAISAGQQYPDTIMYVPTVAQAVAAGLAIAADLLADLDHVELVAARHGIDSLATKVAVLMSELEHFAEQDARAIAADEVPA